MPRRLPLFALALAAVPSVANAQTAAADVRDEIMRHFDASTRKFVMLAEAMPADRYEWSPGEGVMPVAQVYMHVARYNFRYLAENLGVTLPDDVDLSTMESVRDKSQVMETLQRSIDHVTKSVEAMREDALDGQTTLYGRDVPGWAVLMQLVAHMNEHLGQSIAYARMNEVVPPWSR